MWSPNADELSELRSFAVQVAREAGELTLRYFQHDPAVEQKADDTPVTRADRESETLIRRRIHDRYPEDGILGEEFETTHGNGSRTWVIDPIDGTRSFVAGVPLYAVLIGLIEGDFDGSETECARVQVGVIHMPALGETLSAARGLGAVCTSDERGTHTASVSTHAELAAARVTTSDFGQLMRREPTLSDTLRSEPVIARTWGDAYGYLLVATGRCEAMIDPIVSPWDIAPMPVIIEESGGRFSDLKGRSVVGSTALATNGPLHPGLLRP